MNELSNQLFLATWVVIPMVAFKWDVGVQKSLKLRRELFYRTFQEFLPRPRTFIYIFCGKKKTAANVGRWWNPWIHSLSVYVIFGWIFWGIPWVVGIEAGIALWAAAWPLLHGAGALAEGVSTLAPGRCQRLQEVGWGWSLWKLKKPSSVASFLYWDIFLWGFLVVTCHLAWKVECIWILNCL